MGSAVPSCSTISVRFTAGNARHVHQQRASRLHKAVVQLRRQAGERPLHRDRLCGVDRHIVARRLRPANLPHRHAAHLPGRFEREDLSVLPQPVGGAVQHGEELLPLHGLEQVVQGRHLIAFGNVVGVARHEDDLHLLATRYLRVRQRHAVYARHFHVEQQNVRHACLLTGEEKRFRRGKTVDLHRFPRLRGPVPRKRFHIPRVGPVVVAHRHPNAHGRAPFPACARFAGRTVLFYDTFRVLPCQAVREEGFSSGRREMDAFAFIYFYITDMRHCLDEREAWHAGSARVGADWHPEDRFVGQASWFFS